MRKSLKSVEILKQDTAYHIQNIIKDNKDDKVRFLLTSTLKHINKQLLAVEAILKEKEKANG